MLPFIIGAFALLGVTLFFLLPSWRDSKTGYFLLLAMILAKPLLFENAPAIYTTLHAPLLLGMVLLTAAFFTGGFSCTNTSIQRCFFMLTLFVAVCWISRLGDPRGILGHRYINEVTNMWLLFVIGGTLVREREDVERLRKMLLLLVVGIGVASYYHYRILGWEMPLPSLKDVDRNAFAGSMAAFVPLFMSVLLERGQGYYRVLAIAGIVIMLLCIIPSYSRGAFMSLVLALFLCSKMVPNRKQFFALLAIVACAGFLRVSESYLDRLSSTTDYQEEASAAGRLGTYAAALSMARERLAFGIGVGNFNEAFWEHCPEKYQIFCRPGKSIHSIYLQVLAETGVAGLTTFLLFLITVARPWLRLLLKKRLLFQEEYLPYAFGASFAVILFAYLFLPGAYDNLLYPLGAGVVSAFAGSCRGGCDATA
jgi:O-antigen ligase